MPIADVHPETENAVCITFSPPQRLKETFRYTQGQYLTLRTHIDGEEVRRSYSICSAAGEERPRIAVKRIEGGVFSNYANDRLRAGDVIDSMSPQGEFHSPLDPDQEKKYLCIAAGSGITPVLSIVKTVLAVELRSRVTLIYGNRTAESMMFREELCLLKNRYLSRFQWINVFSREEREAQVLNGRINNRKGAELQNRHLISIRDYEEFFLCGPESMMSEVSRGLRGEGIEGRRIHYELFSASAEDARRAVEKHHARAEKHGGTMSRIAVIVDGRTVRFELAPDGENILDAALAHGADVPFSCKGGVCATCKASLIEGEVEMDMNHALSAEEIAGGSVLCCQSHPISRSVTVDFDRK